MSKVDMLTAEGTKGTTLELPALFNVEPKKEVLHQAVVAYLANARQSNAHTKTRGEVSGGGRKPWKQKGTGRARTGSSRNPIWIGGGTVFGPISGANHSKRLPVKIKRLALAMALSIKATAGKLLVINDITVAEAKTKSAAMMLSKLAPKATTALVVVAKLDAVLLQATRNLPNVAVITVNDLNTYDVMNFDTLIMTEAAVSMAQDIFGKK